MKTLPRNMWEKFAVVESYKEGRGKKLVLIIGADDPSYLESKEAMEFAKKFANKNDFYEANGMGAIKLHGQNMMATREFYYKR